MSTHTPSDPTEPISFDELDAKFKEIEASPHDVGIIGLGEKMEQLRADLWSRIAAQKKQITGFETLSQEIFDSVRRVSGVQRTDLDEAVILKNKEKIESNLRIFKERIATIHDRWLQIQSQVDDHTPSTEPTHSAPRTAMNYEPRPVHGHGHGAHSTNTAPEFGNHHWTEREEGEKKPIIDISVNDLERLLDHTTIVNVYTDLAQDNQVKAMQTIKELFDSNYPGGLLESLLSEYNYSLPDFRKLWTEKLWKKIYDIIKQVAEEDIKDLVQARISGSADKMTISSPRKVKQTIASAIAIALPAGITGAAAGFLGAPALAAGAVAGASGVAGRRAITGWWDWASEVYKNIGKEAEAEKETEIEKLRRKEILQEVSEDNSKEKESKVREMASWISQLLRDATTDQAVAKEKKAVREEKTGLRSGDDANLYLARMNAAKRLREEFEDNPDIAAQRIASLDTLLNGINIARHSSGQAHESAQKNYEKKADRKSAQYVHALGEFGADAKVVGKGADDEKKTIGELKFVVAGATIGAGLAAGGWIPAGIAAAGAGYVAYERARRGDLPHIDEKFKKNLEETAKEARELIAEIQKLVFYDFYGNKKEIMEKVKKLEGMLASGAFAKNKPMELLARNAIHDAMRGHGLEFLDRELGYENGEAQRITEKETKRLTKKKFNWDKIKHTLLASAFVVGLKFISLSAQNNDVHAEPVDSPEPTPVQIVPTEAEEIEAPTFSETRAQESIDEESNKISEAIKYLGKIHRVIVIYLSNTNIQHNVEDNLTYKQFLSDINFTKQSLADETFNPNDSRTVLDENYGPKEKTFVIIEKITEVLKNLD